MRILHTSDWHIGKRLKERERLDEQAEVLDEIIEICQREEIELVLLAGDVFDTYTPSAEAEDLFFSKVKTLAGEKRAVLIISGNHDDGTRLCAVTPFAEQHGIFIVGNSRQLRRFGDESRSVHLKDAGKGFAVFENMAGEKVFVSMLPYPNEARFKEEKSDLPYVERIRAWIEEGESANVEKLPSVFMAHLFVLGGIVSDGEREIDLGGARALPVEALPCSDYIALGHLHKKQRMGKGHCYYSGSPLQYSFDESADKGVKVFDLTANGVENLKDVPLIKGKRLIRLEAVNADMGAALLENYPEALVELKLSLNEPLTTADSKRLAGYKNLVSLITEVCSSDKLEFESHKGMSDEALFTAYYRQQYGQEPKASLKELFLATLEEVSND